MEKLQITVTDKRTKNLVIQLLHAIDGVAIKGPRKTQSADPAASLKSLAGIWKGRDISLRKLRANAWKRPNA